MVVPLRFTQAARVLQVGGVVACPTEAVWGLSCDADNEEAVERLLALKVRPCAKGLILVGSSMAQFAVMAWAQHLAGATSGAGARVGSW